MAALWLLCTAPLGIVTDLETLSGWENLRGAGVEVKEIHVVSSNHFDGGCKILGCQPDQPPGWKDPIWPPNCARTKNGPGQPHAYHVLNRYFTNYFPLAADLADQARARNASDPYLWMTQTWVIDLFLNCDRSNYVSDPRYGNHNLLQCPNASAVEKFKRAVSKGDIFWHAASTDQEAGYFPNTALFEASLLLNDRLAKQLGVKRSTALSTRDVPGWTRATIPIMAKHGINGMSFGSGTPPGRPAVPEGPFVWRDEQSNTEVVATWESGYGGTNTLFVLPNGVALAADWSGDNSGPKADFGGLDKLRKAHPGAYVHFSTFSRFFDEANKPEIKAQLPVVTGEIGDAWIYGVPSDPLKNAQFRELGRARDECVRSGKCDTDSPAMRDFDRMLVKLPEHTWGLAQGWWTADYQNYTNEQFNKALASGLADGPLADQSMPAPTKWRGDYYTTVQAWYEQRSFINNAVGAVAKAEAKGETGVPKGWAAELKDRIAGLSRVNEPSAAGLAANGFSKVALGKTGTGVLQCGTAEVKLDESGAVVHLVNKQVPGAASWANSSRPIGQYLYQTFDDDDFQKFLSAPPSGFGLKQCKPSNTGNICGNFNKPNMTGANPKHVEANPTAVTVWQRNTSTGCDFAVEGKMDDELHTMAGAPSRVWSLFTLNTGSKSIHLDLEVRTFDKTTTRLPESIFVVFRPAFENASPVPEPPAGATETPQEESRRQQSGHGWRLEMFNDSTITLDPTDVLVDGHGSGGAPHTRCISGVVRTGPRTGSTADNGVFSLSSADVPCVSTGEPSPFPTPRDGVPDMRMGVAYNIYNNIWGTNYVLWYPFDEKDRDMKSRFSMVFTEG